MASFAHIIPVQESWQLLLAWKPREASAVPSSFSKCDIYSLILFGSYQVLSCRTGFQLLHVQFPD